MISRKRAILTTASLLMEPANYKKFEAYFSTECEELCADVFEWTIRGMGDHSLTIETLRANTFDAKCSCAAKTEFRGVTLRTLYRQWSDHVMRATLDHFFATNGSKT